MNKKNERYGFPDDFPYIDGLVYDKATDSIIITADGGKSYRIDLNTEAAAGFSLVGSYMRTDYMIMIDDHIGQISNTLNTTLNKINDNQIVANGILSGIQSTLKSIANNLDNPPQPPPAEVDPNLTLAVEKIVDLLEAMRRKW